MYSISGLVQAHAYSNCMGARGSYVYIAPMEYTPKVHIGENRRINAMSLFA